MTFLIAYSLSKFHPLRGKNFLPTGDLLAKPTKRCSKTLERSRVNLFLLVYSIQTTRIYIKGQANKIKQRKQIHQQEQ
jgi:hypothetical protein